NNIVGTGRTLVRFRAPLPARSCTATCSQFDYSAVLSDESPSGLLVWVVRRRLPLGVEDDFRVSSRIIDTSQLHGNGTGLPVARERDFRSTFTIHDVPIGGAARVTLRLYSPVQTNVTASVFDGISDPRVVTLKPLNGLAFASVDLSRSIDLRTAPATVTVG